MLQDPPAKRLVLSHGSCIPQLPSLAGCSCTLTVLNRSALRSHRGGCNINYSVAAGVLTWGTAPAENGISAQEHDFVLHNPSCCPSYDFSVQTIRVCMDFSIKNH